MRRSLGAAALVLAIGLAQLVWPFAAGASAQTAASGTGQTYATADEAATALIAALRAGKPEDLLPVLGPSSQKLLDSSDKYADAAQRKSFLDADEEHHELAAAAPDRTILQVGKEEWPLPIPIVQVAGRWHFEAASGAQELVNRRIGRNEIAAIRTSLAYVDAQKAFFAATEKEGEARYVQRLASSPGKYDGLYWPASEGQPVSPLEALVAQAREEGYPVDLRGGERRPYHGYFFRILTEQGASAPQGARNYIRNGRMTEGFAMVAWPASYGASGIMSFIVNQDGVVFQRDLGPRTEAIASTMKRFDPDLTWARVEVVN